MDIFWIFLLVIWAAVEVVQLFSKVPFPRRMIAPLVCVICVGGLIGVGSAPKGRDGEDAIRFLVSALMAGVFGALFYGFRLALAKVWTKGADSGAAAVKNGASIKGASLWKNIIASVALAAAGIATVVVGVAGYDHYRDRQDQIAREAERDALQALKDAVVVTAFHPKGGCPESQPYAYQIENRSTKVVDRVDFDVLIRKVGFSKVLNHVNEYPAFSSDKILKPGEVWALCFGVKVAGYPFAAGDVKDKDVEFEILRGAVKFKDGGR